ncbi:hypothetical protein FEDK69T_20270 [Flavobacterium enshiense DK69]|uniref:DUF4870 domain-containing protein n=1 Tax=Flavobacterium enshiense DK69 TaxID=1107311 RepID=V6S803_9FLAO|nr:MULTISPECIES: DUF4870 domain-containing protein [Flavobacterium]ESU22766.1 hypothetical protein FEDK69T_20270 [Flavobacterium enshiense DK69]KGO95544.1 hypothetical protein Q767_09920 [Flavobacterium enshiense DK69]UOK42379.1 DUF4870 domain-containing protein [Flavobacterium enshiense]
MTTVTEKNTATLVHLSTLTQYFIPLGNYFFPIIIWAFRKDKSEFVDYNGKQTLNFQLSMLLYSLLLAVVAIPSFLFALFNTITFDQLEAGNFEFEQLFSGNDSGLLTVAATALVVFCTLKVVEFFLIIYAAVKASNGENYRYPMSISFLR